jgi:glycosyltransferase involved in cell wall biosynthesis
MNLLFVFEHFHPYTGGAEQLSLGLARGLAADGHRVDVVTTLHDSTLPRIESFNGITVHRIRCYNRFLFTILSLPKLLQLARKCDLIHTASYNAAFPAYVAGLFRKKKVVVTFHEVWGKLWMQLPFTPKLTLFLYYLYEFFLLKLPFNKFIAVSKSTAQSLQKAGVSEDRIVTIYNGLESSVFSDIKHAPPSTPVFCFFGRLGISKGLELIPDAFLQISKKYPEARLKIILPTYPENLFLKVERLYKSSIPESQLFLLHNLPFNKLLKEVSESTCVLIPSHSEGFCFAAAEAVAINVPVISSGKGALPEVVGGRHLALQLNDSVHLASAMEKAIKGEWETLPLRRFELSECVQRHLHLYTAATGITDSTKAV